MRSAAHRSSKYGAKVVGDVSKSRLDRYRGTQVGQFSKVIGGQVAIELKVKQLMETLGISPLYTNYYILFAKNLAKKRLAESVVEYNKWFARGMRHEWLRWIGRNIDRDRLDTRKICEFVDQGADLPLYLPMSEGTGTTAHDYSGHGNDGAFNGTPTWVPGMIGQAVDFDVTTDFIQVAHNANLCPDYITVAAWINIDDVIQNFATIVRKGGVTLGYHLMFDALTGKIGFWVNSAVTGWGGGSVAPALQNDTWYFVVGVYNGANVTVYVNNVATIVAPAHTGALVATADPLYIGNSAFGGIDLDGTVDEVRVWNRALSAAEIQRIYDSERPD